MLRLEQEMLSAGGSLEVGARFCSKMDEGGSSQWQLINSIKSAEGGGWEGILGDIFQVGLKKWGVGINQHSRRASPSPYPFVTMCSHNHIWPKDGWTGSYFLCRWAWPKFKSWILMWSASSCKYILQGGARIMASNVAFNLPPGHEDAFNVP